MRRIATAVLLAALLLAACGSDDDYAFSATATADMVAPDGARVGIVTLEEGPNGVLVSAHLEGLTPGSHGFHIHTIGTCTPDFAAAGDHFAPNGHSHGFLHAAPMHAGDLPNLHAAANGTAAADFFTDRITLNPDADTSLFDADGSAFIVHALPDSYGAEAGAGGRVACGVIEHA